ncbi:MAG: GNAT family N-acetyltransferase [Thermoplasmata archaeon]|nr:GNAT family N-acetyltransferase [Thermoplasmata archaeon]
MIVRELRWNDFEPLTEMYFHLYEERAAGESIGISLFAERPSTVDEVEWFANLYRKCLERQWFTSIAEEDGRAIGNCTIQPQTVRADSELGHIGVLGILVDHRFRGKGAGRALMIHALEQARGRFEIIRLSVFADNLRAKELYRRLGFETYGRLPRAIHRGDRYIDEEFMFLDLGKWAAPPGAPNR